ncbi:MAG: VOC family protein [bacterium]
MKSGAFIWADLSTYNVSSSANFYNSVFGWHWYDMSSYLLAQTNNQAIAGLYETPAFFQKIKMPHFWMSYFQVTNVEDAITSAEQFGGKVELKDTTFNEGNIALIRDPQGAGFTVYDGNALHFPKGIINNTIIATELQVSNLEHILPFYKAIFGWQYQQLDTDTYQVISDSESNAITLREIPNSIKGNYEYWVTTIKVTDLNKTKEAIETHGGNLITVEGSRLMCCDNSQEAFFYIQE